MAQNTAVFVLERGALAALPGILRDEGHIVLGPMVRDGAIVLEEIDSLEDLPIGWTAEQSPGACRLRKRHDAALFGFAVGPQSPKTHLHPADVRLFRATRARGGIEIRAEETPPAKVALFGVRACDLAAIARQDRVLLAGAVADPIYEARRAALFCVAVHCSEPAATCFCASMGTGPRAREGFDLALTELIDDHGHRFLIEAGSRAGSKILARLSVHAASAADVEAGESALEEAARAMIRAVDPEAARDLLPASVRSPVWDEIAERCLGCANCTMVCPTCFCTTVEDVTDLSGERAERRRCWDSCFTFEFSHLAGGVVRTSTAARYRQWLTHKLSTWYEQFGTSGCVGCGRCISWCPVGIDLTEEVRRLGACESDGVDAARGGSRP